MKKFIRIIEDFTCAHCGAAVHGGGYTNHCPKCLWSRDVDVNPGDRAGTCGGMMRPVAVAPVGDHFVITHKCEKCGKQRRQRASADDNMDAIIALSANPEFIFGIKN
ncbi:MAG: RNHCP domain-containing protein [Rickettsiales bacterium]|jgi:Zn finger protein HypA/HybF involved in hydrogenase expression|nr:RNHCP domain-containing protein [Rickettsiales bacterium]